VKQQCQQSANLRFIRLRIAQYAREPDRLFGKSHGALIATRRVFPTAAVRCIVLRSTVR
jgi:hypothetical protein